MAYAFPFDLANEVIEKWQRTIVGQYAPPPLPSDQQLRNLLEVAYLASLETDEGRHLQFTLCCTPRVDSVRRQHQDGFVEAWPLVSSRSLELHEIRRLASVVDLDTSAIWIRYPEQSELPSSIHGLLNLGVSWSNARSAFAYHYESLPDALLVRAQAPGQLLVYQGQYMIALLRSGSVEVAELSTMMSLLGVYPLFQEGHDLLRTEIPEPRHEEPREWYEFEWLAYVNTILAIINSIQLRGHGGALILASKDCELIKKGLVRIKYRFREVTSHLRSCFTDFMALRHKLGDMWWLIEAENESMPTEAELRLADYFVQEAHRRLSETCKLIGDLSGTDGAIVLRTDFSVEGFGTEILLDKAPPSKVFEVRDPAKKEKVELDSEKFGMRHRSAMRLCSIATDLVVFVISQDGEVSLVWNDNGDTCFKSGLTTTNTNMPLA